MIKLWQSTNPGLSFCNYHKSDNFCRHIDSEIKEGYFLTDIELASLKDQVAREAFEAGANITMKLEDIFPTRKYFDFDDYQQSQKKGGVK